MDSNVMRGGRSGDVLLGLPRTSRPRRRRALLAAMLLGSAVLGACGGDDDSPGATAPSTAEESSTPSTTSTTVASAESGVVAKDRSGESPDVELTLVTCVRDGVSGGGALDAVVIEPPEEGDPPYFLRDGRLTLTDLDPAAETGSYEFSGGTTTQSGEIGEGESVQFSPDTTDETVVLTYEAPWELHITCA